MRSERQDQLTDAELHALLDRLFPRGVAGADVLAELAPESWERSPLVACFHPSAERVFEETLRIHRNLADLRHIGRRRAARGAAQQVSLPEPTLENVRQSHQPTPVKPAEEMAELVGLCLWDVFADNHEVITADGRMADLGSFRGASAFLDEHLSRDSVDRREGDYMRFYMGTFAICGRADLTPVYAMIFRRLRAVGGDWTYHFPELLLVDFGSSHGAALRADLAASNDRAREMALDAPPPATILAYREVYGRDPCGWPPA